MRAVTLVQSQVAILAAIAVTAAIIVAVKNAAGGSSGKIKIAATDAMIAVADVTVVAAAIPVAVADAVISS